MLWRLGCTKRLLVSLRPCSLQLRTLGGGYGAHGTFYFALTRLLILLLRRLRKDLLGLAILPAFLPLRVLKGLH